jgi:hypothetical protein
MKVNFKTEGFTTVIEGTPVDVKPITVEVELSVMEMAQGGANIIKALDTIKEYFNTPTKHEPEIICNRIERVVVPATKSTENFCEVPPTKEEPKLKLDLLMTFKALEKNLTAQGWVSDNLGNIKYKPDNAKRNIAEINLDETSITIKDMTVQGESIVTWLYDDRVRFGGIAPQFARNYYENSKISGMMDIYQVIKDFIKY